MHQSEIDTFIASYDRLVKAAYPDGPTSKDYTSIINDQQHAMLTDLIDDARAHGARIIEVGHRPGEASRRPHTLAPTVVLGVTDDMRIAHEEIFGPILPIFPYRDINDAVDYVSARPRPLALYYFGDNDADRRKVLDRTTSGNVTINGTIMHVAQDDSRSAASAPVGWANITGSRASGHSATPRASTCKDAGTAPASCAPPSARLPMPSSTFSFDDRAGGHRRRRRLPP